jgi:hypothetical protein
MRLKKIINVLGLDAIYALKLGILQLIVNNLKEQLKETWKSTIKSYTSKMKMKYQKRS